MSLHANEATFQTTWFVISLLTELAFVLVLRTRQPAFRNRSSRLLLCITAVMCAAALATPFLGPLSSALGFAPLSGPEIVAIFAIVIGYIAATEAAKMWFYRSPSTPAGERIVRLPIDNR